MTATLTKKLRLDNIGLLLRLRPFDTSTEAGRAQERHRRIVLSAAGSFGAKGFSFLSTIISVPLTVRYLGAERFGLWMAISSFVSLFSFADLGIGNGLVNALSEAHGREDREAARRYVSSAFFLFCGIALLILGIFAAAYPLVPWARLFNVTTPIAQHEAGPAVAALVISFALGLPTGIAQRVQTGHQDGLSNSIWACVGSVLGLIAMLIAILFHAGLPLLVFAISGAGPLAGFVNCTYLFGRQRRWLAPIWRAVSSEPVRRVFNLGFFFVVIQIAAILSFSTDNLVAAQVLGASAVAQYAVPFKLFWIPSTALTTVLAPLWPAYGEAIARGDAQWVRRTLMRSLKYSMALAITSSIVLIVFGRTILYYWAGKEIHPTFMLLLGLGTWTVMYAFGASISMFLNGVGAIRLQAGLGMLTSIPNLILSIILARKMGVAGVIWGTNIAYGLLMIVPLFYFVPRLLKKIAENPQTDQAPSRRGFEVMPTVGAAVASVPETGD